MQCNLGNVMNKVDEITEEADEKVNEIDKNVTRELNNYKSALKKYKSNKQQLLRVKAAKSTKFKAVIRDYKRLLESRKHEIQTLNDELAALTLKYRRASAMNEEVMALDIDGKLDTLQSYVKKWNRRKNRKLQSYARKVKQLRKVIADYDSNMRLRLAVDKSRLTVKLYEEHQREVERVVTNLEVKYKGYFNELKEYMNTLRMDDERTIKELRSEIHRLTKRSNISHMY